MEVTKLLTEQILIRDQLKLSKFEMGQHIYENQRSEGVVVGGGVLGGKGGAVPFYETVDSITTGLSRHQNEIKKLAVKQNKYIANTKQENYLFM